MPADGETRAAVALRLLRWARLAYLAVCVVAIVSTVRFHPLGVAYPIIGSLAFSMVTVTLSVWLFGLQVRSFHQYRADGTHHGRSRPDGD